jgi:hypothetical protein
MRKVLCLRISTTEGLSGESRYYGGCESRSTSPRQLAIDRAKRAVRSRLREQVQSRIRGAQANQGGVSSRRLHPGRYRARNVRSGHGRPSHGNGASVHLSGRYFLDPGGDLRARTRDRRQSNYTRRRRARSTVRKPEADRCRCVGPIRSSIRQDSASKTIADRVGALPDGGTWRILRGSRMPAWSIPESRRCLQTSLLTDHSQGHWRGHARLISANAQARAASSISTAGGVFPPGCRAVTHDARPSAAKAVCFQGSAFGASSRGVSGTKVLDNARVQGERSCRSAVFPNRLSADTRLPSVFLVDLRSKNINGSRGGKQRTGTRSPHGPSKNSVPARSAERPFSSERNPRPVLLP